MKASNELPTFDGIKRTLKFGCMLMSSKIDSTLTFAILNTHFLSK